MLIQINEIRDLGDTIILDNRLPTLPSADKKIREPFSRLWLVWFKSLTSFGDGIGWYPTVLILIWRVSRIISTLFFISVLFVCAKVGTIQLFYAIVVQLSQLFESITS